MGEAYRRRGHLLIERGGRRPDGGVDLVLCKEGKRTLVQCKHRRANQVGVSVARELYGVMAAEKADTAVMVSSGSFTEEAKAFAAGKPIELVDGPPLLDLVKNVQ